MVAANSPATWRDLRCAVLRHKKKALLFFLLTMTAAAAAAVLLPRKYHSEGRLFVRVGRENATLDPTATLSQETVVAVPSSRETEINSVVEILRSRTIAEKAVDALGPTFVLEKKDGASSAGDDAANESPGWGRRIGGAVSSARDWLRRLEGAPEMSDRDRAVTELLDCYSVSPGRKSAMVGIECQGPSPRWAQKVVAELIDLYEAEHMRLNRPQGSFQFFTEQSQRLQRELAKKEEELRDLKTATGLASPTEQRQALVTRIARLQDELLQAEAERSTLESRVQALRSQVATVPGKLVREETAGVSNGGSDQMRAQLYQLQIKKEEAAAKYTEAHPEMQAAIQLVAAAEEAMRKEQPTRTQVTTATNRVHEEAQLSLLAQEPSRVSLQAKVAALQRQLAGVQGELKSLNDNELRIAKLQREVELQQVAYRKYAVDLEQARIDQALQEQRMSNISVAQPATYEPKPVYPRKGLLLLFGLMFGMLGGVGLALLADWRDHSFHAAEDVERYLELAVLGSIPRLREKDLELKMEGSGKK